MNRNSVVVAGGLVALAAAILYHASAVRYDVTHLNPLAIVRTDRLTGHSELCVEHRSDGTMTCRATGDTTTR